MERDGKTLEEERAALEKMIERIEFDPATGEGRIQYRIAAAPGAGRFSARNAAGLGLAGYRWRPHGDSNPGYRRERAVRRGNEKARYRHGFP